MAETGILGSDDRVELLDGEILEMTPIGPRHAFAGTALGRLLTQLLGDRAVVRIQYPVVLDDFTEPQPDVAVCIPARDEYRTNHPRPPDVFLVVEVADTTVAWDRLVKMRRYARAGVPEAWLVDLGARSIETYREPGADGYALREVFGPGERLAFNAFPDVTLEVDEIV